MELQKLHISKPDKIRFQSGKELAASVKELGSGDFKVPSVTHDGAEYRVHLGWIKKELYGICSCEDFGFRLMDSIAKGEAPPCKHIWAVIFFREEHPNGETAPPLSPVSPPEEEEEERGSVVESPVSSQTGLPAATFSSSLPTVDQAKELMQRYREIKREVLDDSAFYEVKTLNGTKEMLNRRGCSIISMMFQLTEPDQPHLIEKDVGKNGTKFRVFTKVCAPNGRCSWGVGECTTAEIEERRHPKETRDPAHDAVTKAHTRAKSRAIMDLIGGGEVTEENLSKKGAR